MKRSFKKYTNLVSDLQETEQKICFSYYKADIKLNNYDEYEKKWDTGIFDLCPT